MLMFCLHVALIITQNQAMAEDAAHNAFLSIIKHKEGLCVWRLLQCSLLLPLRSNYLLRRRFT